MMIDNRPNAVGHVLPIPLDNPAQPGTVRRPCPYCAKGKNDKALSITRKPDGAIVWFCHRCEDRGAWGGDGGVRSRGARETAPAEPANASERARHDQAMRVILAGCRAISANDPVGRYLSARGGLPLPQNDVFYHPGLHDNDGNLWPCMVALVTDVLTNEPRTLHRTFITPDGLKAPIERPRSLLKGGRKQGGVIRLFDDAEVTLGIGVAEGVENALSAVAMGWQPVWACIDAGNLAAFPALDGIECITVFIDNDPPNKRTGKRAGQSAFAAVAARWHAAGKEVRHVLPPPGDLNDYLAGTTA